MGEALSSMAIVVEEQAAPERAVASRWCILRTAPSRTLLLVASLMAVDIPTWTPTEVQKKRVTRNGNRERQVRAVPIVPGIVFADYDRLPRLVSISRSPGMVYQSWDADQRRMVTRDHPPFAVFRHLDSYPSVSDRALDPLRLEERKATPMTKARSFRPGEEVRCPGSGFDGMVGIVQSTKGKWTLVLFPGFRVPVDIAPQRLLPAA